MGQGGRFYGLFTEDERPIGLMALMIDTSPLYAGYSELLDIGVNAAYRRRGHGTALVEHALRLSRDAGVHCMLVMTYAGSTDVIRFYGKNGLVPVATIPDVHGPDDEGRIVMRRRL